MALVFIIVIPGLTRDPGPYKQIVKINKFGVKQAYRRAKSWIPARRPE